MKKRIMDLRIFDEGEGTGNSGTQGNNGGTSSNATGYSYEQAEEIANARAQKAAKEARESIFKQLGISENEVSEAVSDYKQKKAGSQPDVETITKERDEALKKLENMEHEKLLTNKGVRADDMDYVLFKVGKLVDEKTDFAKAAEKFLKENPRYAGGTVYRVSTGPSNSDKGSGGSSNSTINDAIRNGARK